MSFLEIDNVHKSFGHNEVLKGVSLNVERHEVVCLIGASGSGKSTLLRCVNALEDISAGEIRIDGDTVSGAGVDLNALRRDVGIVFQSYNLFPHMSVIDNITLGPTRIERMSKKDAVERAMRLLTSVGMAEKAKAYPDSLSGGQQQRVAIVRALAMQPRVMLLDEITAALDPELVGDVLQIVRELAHGGLTMLLATHEMGFAKEVASQVCFLDNGTILERGSAQDIFENPREERTQQFLSRVVAVGTSVSHLTGLRSCVPITASRSSFSRQSVPGRGCNTTSDAPSTSLVRCSHNRSSRPTSGWMSRFASDLRTATSCSGHSAANSGLAVSRSATIAASSGSLPRRPTAARRSAACVRECSAQSSSGTWARLSGSVNQRQVWLRRRPVNEVWSPDTSFDIRFWTSSAPRSSITKAGVSVSRSSRYKTPGLTCAPVVRRSGAGCPARWNR